MKDFLLILFSVSFAVCGQLFLKQGMLKIGFIYLDPFSLPRLLFKALLSPFVLLGIGLYSISTLFWLVVLSRINLGVAYPMASIGYVITVFFSWLLFKEEVGLMRILGCLVICLGVFLISRS